VVFVSTSYNDGTSAARAWVYSSETAAWSAPASVQIQYGGSRPQVERKRAPIFGYQIYFLLCPGAGILKYDLMTMDDGSLGFAGVKDDYSTLHLWATKVNPNGYMGWVQDRVILLNNLPVPIIRIVDTYNKVIDVVGG
jgi:hypothetical protein